MQGVIEIFRRIIAVQPIFRIYIFKYRLLYIYSTVRYDLNFSLLGVGFYSRDTERSGNQSNLRKLLFQNVSRVSNITVR